MQTQEGSHPISNEAKLFSMLGNWFYSIDCRITTRLQSGWFKIANLHSFVCCKRWAVTYARCLVILSKSEPRKLYFRNLIPFPQIRPIESEKILQKPGWTITMKDSNTPTTHNKTNLPVALMMNPGWYVKRLIKQLVLLCEGRVLPFTNRETWFIYLFATVCWSKTRVISIKWKQNGNPWMP